ncbi:MAG: cyclase family protein [Bacilli bacterium]
MNRILDISMPIHQDMPVYKDLDAKRTLFETTSDFTLGATHETRLHMDAHAGTHVDAPLHMIEGGAGVESILLSQLIRPCRVVDLTAVRDAVTREDIVRVAPAEGEFLLMKTQNSFSEVWNSEFVYLREDAANYLAAVGVAGVGIDGLGVERSQPDHPTHKTLMRAGAIIIEGLRLGHVEPGVYNMVAAPLAVMGIDAAPARVILLEQA